MKILQGICRKASLPIVGVAALGWLVFVVGFAAFNNGDNFYNDIRKDHTIKDKEGRTIPLGFSAAINETIEEDYPPQRADADFFPFWCFVISVPVLLVFLVLHLVLHNLYIFGVIGHLLLGLCLLCGSGVFWSDGRVLFSNDDNLREQWQDILPVDWRRDTYYGLWLVVEWVGAFVSILALIAYMVFLPFYTTTSCKRDGDSSKDGE